MNAAQAEHILNSWKEFTSVERIADGRIARKGDWPWQASLQVEGIHLCGASLISEEWLLTAAHYFDFKKNPKLWTASFGITLSSSLMRRKVESIIIHENYAAHKHEDDIAVVKLSIPIIFSNEVHRVCLPEATFEALPESASPNTLREDEVEIISNNICNQVHVYGGAVSSGMICAGFLTGKQDACKHLKLDHLANPKVKTQGFLVGEEENKLKKTDIHPLLVSTNPPSDDITLATIWETLRNTLTTYHHSLLATIFSQMLTACSVEFENMTSMTFDQCVNGYGTNLQL
ncbi:Transmembrane protease serine 11G [Saguinus oedipus]|uniref:Transmembrane protease serine 11G n=1 Tax=Saguinus oedipus TaxID=9490 RepID=A0ABQ9W346_SAGOE|nr:Transmembrane protease serine 11G [Saguinus oedipus]